MTSNFDPPADWLSLANPSITDGSEQSLIPVDDLSHQNTQFDYQDQWPWNSWDGTAQTQGMPPTIIAPTSTQQQQNEMFTKSTFVTTPAAQLSYIPQAVNNDHSQMPITESFSYPINPDFSPSPQAMPPSTAQTSKPEIETTGSSPQSPKETKPRTQRERNRLAAHKCRQKSKFNAEELQKQERELAEQHRCLTQHVQFLKNEVLDLKNEVLRHGNCNCELIAEYIVKATQGLP